MIDIPWDKLGVPDALRARVEPGAPRAERLAVARANRFDDAQIGASALYALAVQEDPELRDAAVAAVRALPHLARDLGQRTHPKVLEFVAEVVEDRAVLARLLEIRATNDRAALLVTRRADAELCGIIARNHERLLITPEVVLALHANPACSEDDLERAVGFLRMNQSLPPLPAERGKAPPPPAFDLDKEIEAALAGQTSPLLEARKKLEMFDLDKVGGPLEGFEFSFSDTDDFSLDLLEDAPEGARTEEENLTIEKRIAAMSVGKKIKLAYLGNKEVRAILIRDRSKMVAVAVVKSGRLTDSEVAAYAGNRNMHADVLREISMNKEWMRKYPVQVALVNNPRCPPSVGVSLVGRMQAKELDALARNRNVSSVVFQLATKLQREKKNARG